MTAGTSVPAAGMVKLKASARCRYESGGFSRGPGVRGRDGAPALWPGLATEVRTWAGGGCLLVMQGSGDPAKRVQRAWGRASRSSWGGGGGGPGAVRVQGPVRAEVLRGQQGARAAWTREGPGGGQSAGGRMASRGRRVRCGRTGGLRGLRGQSSSGEAGRGVGGERRAVGGWGRPDWRGR